MSQSQSEEMSCHKLLDHDKPGQQKLISLKYLRKGNENHTTIINIFPKILYLTTFDISIMIKVLYVSHHMNPEMCIDQIHNNKL